MAATPILEFRRYTLRPGQRDRLIDLFEAELLDPQEELGMMIKGTFRDLDDPSKFVWLREFSSMEDRPRALESFYYGPVWRRHSHEANAMMLDSDDVLLLRPGRADTNVTPHAGHAAHTAHATVGAAPIVEASVLSFDERVTEPALTYFEQQIVPAVVETGGSILGWFVTVEEPNNFPPLPVREGEGALLWLATGTEPAEDVEAQKRLAAVAASSPGLIRRPQLLRLGPTRRSRLPWRPDGPRALAGADRTAVSRTER